MLNVLFICHGNICRSPMAEFLFKDLVTKKDLQDKFNIASAATSQEEIGNPVYPPVKEILNSLGIDCSHKRARQVTYNDFDEYDYLIVMDENNIYNMHNLFKGRNFEKVFKLKDFSMHKGDIDDPWYTRDFARTQKEITISLNDFLEYLERENLI